MGPIKDRNGRDQTEAEHFKKRWQEYAGELYKKDLHDPEKHHGVITLLGQDIMECKEIEEKTIEWERLAISSRKLEIQREYFMQRWAQ